MSRRPRGFTILAVVLAIQLVGNLIPLLAAPPLRSGHPPLEAVLALLVVVLKAVTVEALWRVRPWATRAFGMMSATLLAGLYLRSRGDTDGTFVILGLLLFAAVLALIGVYIGERLRARSGPAPRVPVPRPRPPAPGRIP